MNEAISRRRRREWQNPAGDGGAIRRSEEARRTKLRPARERVRASFGAPPLSEPINPSAREAGLRPLPILDRPGLLPV